MAMLSLVETSGMQELPQLYQALIEALPSQLASMDKGFLEDVDEVGNNFLLPSLRTLCHNMTQAEIVNEGSMLEFQRLLSNKFPCLLILNEECAEAEDEWIDRHDTHEMENDSDSDAPVVVDMVDVEASLARSAGEKSSGRSTLPLAVQMGYPLLVAAILPHEDILMTCARALDEKNDVSLVREAAAYLEEVEQRRL